MPSIPAGFTAFNASHIQDASGVVLLAGTLSVEPTDSNDIPIAATSGGAGGAILVRCATVAVETGSVPINFWVSDTSRTRPPNICYRVTVRDPSGMPIFTLPKVQPSGPFFNLDTYDPTTPVIPTGTASATPPTGITFIDTITGNHLTITYANGEEKITTGGADIGTPIHALILTDTMTGTPVSISYANGEEVVTT
ncbi:MAG TPA: hypothetical protein VFG23_22660 [Polyangia bacterium]|nr:hypothetical protein [Polyangia bacterium]